MIRQLAVAVNHVLSHFELEVRRTGNSRHPDSYYPLSSSCQIATLSVIYEEILGKRDRGFFVEVGAFDGESFSNTSGLADLGWSGLYIEPVPAFAQKTRERHSRNSGVTVINKAAGPTAGTIQISVAGPLTTPSQEMAQSYESIDWAQDAIKNSTTIAVEQARLDDILRDNGVAVGFDVLVIDTEGYEGEVLAGFSLADWRPRMIIIELADFHPDITHRRDEDRGICAMISAHGYRIVYKDSINTVFCTEEA